MPHRRAFIIAFLTLLAACGDNSKTSSTSPPVRSACTTPEQAGAKAADITRKLVEARKLGTMTQEQYTSHNITLSNGLRAWAERQDLRAYCAALAQVVRDAGI